MNLRRFLALLLSCGIGSCLQAGEIRGVVTVKRKLTRRILTLPLNPYERGIAVPPVTREDRDPLAYERTHTVIYLEGELPNPAPAPSLSIVQENRRFVPDLVALPAGSVLSFPNLDPIFHNVFSLSKAKSFDLGNYRKGQTRSVILNKPGIVLVNCRIHTNMSAVVVVTPNGFYAIPDDRGHFSIKGVPNGRFTVAAWHKSAGILRKDVVVGEEAPAIVDFLVPLGDAGESRAPLAYR